MENIFFALAIVVLTIAAVYLVRAFANFLLQKRKNPLFALTVLPVRKESEDIEYTVRNIVWSSSWDRITNQELLLVVFSDCTDETMKICEKLSEQYAVVSFCFEDELPDFINIRLKN